MKPRTALLVLAASAIVLAGVLLFSIRASRPPQPAAAPFPEAPAPELAGRRATATPSLAEVKQRAEELDQMLYQAVTRSADRRGSSTPNPAAPAPTGSVPGGAGSGTSSPPGIPADPAIPTVKPSSPIAPPLPAATAAILENLVETEALRPAVMASSALDKILFDAVNDTPQ